MVFTRTLCSEVTVTRVLAAGCAGAAILLLRRYTRKKPSNSKQSLAITAAEMFNPEETVPSRRQYNPRELDLVERLRESERLRASDRREMARQLEACQASLRAEKKRREEAQRSRLSQFEAQSEEYLKVLEELDVCERRLEEEQAKNAQALQEANRLNHEIRRQRRELEEQIASMRFRMDLLEETLQDDGVENSPLSTQ